MGVNSHHTILIAHGSRNPKTEIFLTQKCQQLREKGKSVSLAFLELCEPSIEQAIDEAIKSHKHIRCAPYFLAPGKHVLEDVPKVVSAKQQQYSQVLIELIDCFGQSDDCLEALANWL